MTVAGNSTTRLILTFEFAADNGLFRSARTCRTQAGWGRRGKRTFIDLVPKQVLLRLPYRDWARSTAMTACRFAQERRRLGGS